jgi:hypothetical protein
MKNSTQILLALGGCLVMTLVACLLITMFSLPILGPVQDPAPDASATVQAIVTQTMVAMTQNAPSPTTVLPTPTQVIATNTAVPTAISYCDWITFVGDVTIPDGAVFTPGETFIKTWRLQNRGTCTWAPDYTLVFSGGSQMGATTALRLPGYVTPGQTVDVSVALTAPPSTGEFTGYWMLRSPSGLLFGYGDQADKAFYVDILVYDLPHGTVTGTICYPSEFNPPLTHYFEMVDTAQVIQFSIPESHMNFSVLLPKGTYYAYAWTPGYNLEGAYVNGDGYLKPLVVKGGQTTTDINICDWGPEHHSRAHY